MKKSIFKKLLSSTLVCAMLLTFAACGGSGNSGNTSDDSEDPAVTEQNADIAAGEGFEDEDLSYVMIYNPNIFSEKSDSNYSLRVGDFGTQIEVDGDRAEVLEPEREFVRSDLSQQMEAIEGLNINTEGNRGDVLGVEYELGDIKEFYTDDNSGGPRTLTEMMCIYSGEYCNIWSDGSGDLDFIESLGSEFDENIYEQETACFGTPRFVDGVGRVNCLFYGMQGGVCGFFYPGDMYTSNEMSDAEAEYYGANRDHAIIHINSALSYSSDYHMLCKATLSHEFQHLICGKYKVEDNVDVANWLNEAMSGYIEESFYPGSKEDGGDYYGYNNCEYIRGGQSLYNFYRGNSDMGRYGSVYYYTEYLSDLAGDDVFSKIHDNMPYSETQYNDYEALANALPEDVKSEIDERYEYPVEIQFDNEDQELMSKLTLDFYINTFSNDDIKNFDNIDRYALLYDSLDGADIEGGGRVVVAVKNGEFTFPEDSDEGLIYVGLDSDFNVIGYAYN